MGTWFAALTSDVERFNVDVPAINFSILLQRATQFSDFDPLLDLIGLGDPMDNDPRPRPHPRAVGEGRAGRLRALAREPRWRANDQEDARHGGVARQAGVATRRRRSWRAASAFRPFIGSVQQGLQEIPDLAGPLDSALVIYDTGSFDIFDPAHYASTSRPAADSAAGQPDSRAPCAIRTARRGISIPASIDQLTAFLQPGGQILNFCTGVCDGVEVNDQPAGGPCDPLARTCLCRCLSRVGTSFPGCLQDPPQSGGGRDLRSNSLTSTPPPARLRPRAHEHRPACPRQSVRWVRRVDSIKSGAPMGAAPSRASPSRRTAPRSRAASDPPRTRDTAS